MIKNFKILIIDDDSKIINSIIDLLESENPNYIFYQATDGNTGCEISRRYLPDIIITDWEMPELNGIETIKRLKADFLTKHIPVIMLTGKMTKSEHLKTALEAGAIDFIRKPIDKIELTARTYSMLMLAESYNEIVNLKNRELTTTAMNIVQNNQFNLSLIEDIKKLNLNYGTGNKKLSYEFQKLLNNIGQKIKGEAWKHFETYFRNVHPTFFENLNRKFPDLTPAELKLAAFIRLNLNSKEIASIIFITPQSVKTARTRLRKKLNLSHEQNIVSFLMEF